MSTSYWTLFYIAQEIDQPFGEDSNDLPVVELQHEFNKNLLHLSSQPVLQGEKILDFHKYHWSTRSLHQSFGFCSRAVASLDANTQTISSGSGLCL
ncbi:Ubiquitin-conjugating enzyme E2 11 [Durusdinium trenchii]|uniref:Ubiquitin-conjugating enzyme E2 11 n=1 Tax=Durusdinium trenchii TaxID=1381693 RepID=A0ABP0PAD0_9DINO